MAAKPDPSDKSAAQTWVYCQSAICQKYRTFDGSCFNLKNPQMGKAGSTFGRYYPANYADGILLLYSV